MAPPPLPCPECRHAPPPFGPCPTCHGEGTVTAATCERTWARHIARTHAQAAAKRGANRSPLFTDLTAHALPPAPAPHEPVPCPACRKRHGKRWQRHGCRWCHHLAVTTYDRALTWLRAQPTRHRPPRPPKGSA